MEKHKEVELLFQYLKILQEGRTKPDKKGTAGTIRESLDNVDDIMRVKKKISKIMELDGKDT